MQQLLACREDGVNVKNLKTSATTINIEEVDVIARIGSPEILGVAKNVATPLWAKCEGEAHTPKSGKLESSGTPKNSERNCRGQISLHLSALGVIGKVLKFKCPKWPRMSHLDIYSPSYGQKKGRDGSQTGNLTPDH
jgi:hypothetical protein